VSAPPALVALSPGDLPADAARRRPFLAGLEEALAAGLPGLLLREPALEDGPFLELASEVQTCIDRTRRPWLALHDRPHLARAVGADAVHLSFRSLRPSELLDLLTGLGIGVSTHAGDDWTCWRGATYRFHGPVLATPSKAGLRDPIGFDGLARAAQASDVPVLAIGGLGPEHVTAARAAGAHGVAVLRGILGAPAPGAAVEAYLAALSP
jgi:thiamine-phosphate diphosphorylase